MCTYFEPNNRAHRTVAQWRASNHWSWRGNAKAFARLYGEAKVFRADGTVLRFWMDAGTLRQRTYHTVTMIT